MKINEAGNIKYNSVYLKVLPNFRIFQFNKDYDCKKNPDNFEIFLFYKLDLNCSKKRTSFS